MGHATFCIFDNQKSNYQSYIHRMKNNLFFVLFINTLFIFSYSSCQTNGLAIKKSATDSVVSKTEKKGTAINVDTIEYNQKIIDIK